MLTIMKLRAALVGAMIAVVALFAMPAGLLAGPKVSGTKVVKGKQVVYQRVTTDDEDHHKCKAQPCSDDGVWQASSVNLSIGPVPAGYHLENVTMTGDGTLGQVFCDRPPNMNVSVASATASTKCWSHPVTWILQGAVVKNIPY